MIIMIMIFIFLGIFMIVVIQSEVVFIKSYV